MMMTNEQALVWLGKRLQAELLNLAQAINALNSCRLDQAAYWQAAEKVNEVQDELGFISSALHRCCDTSEPCPIMICKYDEPFMQVWANDDIDVWVEGRAYR